MDRKSDYRSAVVAPLPGAAKGTAVSAVDDWFEREILPLEASLMQYLERNWRNPSDIPDFRQDIYVRIYEAAQKEIPEHAGKFLLTTARNFLINKAKQARIIPIQTAGNLEEFDAATDMPGPERVVQGREELRHLQAALDQLPPRAREAIVLRRVHGLTRSEIARRMGINEVSVSRYLSRAICALADVLHGEPSNIRRRP